MRLFTISLGVAEGVKTSTIIYNFKEIRCIALGRGCFIEFIRGQEVPETLKFGFIFMALNDHWMIPLERPALETECGVVSYFKDLKSVLPTGVNTILYGTRAALTILQEGELLYFEGRIYIYKQSMLVDITN